MKGITTAAPSIATIAEKVRITQIFEHGFFAIVILLAVWTNAWSADGAGTVKTLTGSATVIRTSAALPIATGQRVFSGDRIVSAQDGYVGIMLYDDTRLTIGPGSELLIREFEFNANSYVGNLTVSFLKGTARVVTGLIGKNSPENMRFNTPTATIGIRGTEFIVDVSTE